MQEAPRALTNSVCPDEPPQEACVPVPVPPPVPPLVVGGGGDGDGGGGDGDGSAMVPLVDPQMVKPEEDTEPSEYHATVSPAPIATLKGPVDPLYFVPAIMIQSQQLSVEKEVDLAVSGTLASTVQRS